jgi:hypothetical protein
MDVSLDPDPAECSEAGPFDQPAWKVLKTTIGVAILIVALLLGGAGWQIYSTLKTEDGLTATAYDEWASAKADHAGIVAIAGQCQPASTPLAHPLAVPASLLTIIPNGWRGKTLPTGMLPDPALSALKLEAPSYLLAAIILSNDIGRSRVAVAEDKVRDDAWMQVFEWALILVGAITTVLISIKSIASERCVTFTAIGIGAIIFSTLGTSIAAVNSFYSPRTTYEYDQRTLTELRNLHLQLATGIAREGNLCSAWTNWSGDWRFARIKALSDQYAMITNMSQTGDLPAEGGDATAANGLEPATFGPAGVPSASNHVAQ